MPTRGGRTPPSGTCPSWWCRHTVVALPVTRTLARTLARCRRCHLDGSKANVRDPVQPALGGVWARTSLRSGSSAAAARLGRNQRVCHSERSLRSPPRCLALHRHGGSVHVHQASVKPARVHTADQHNGASAPGATEPCGKAVRCGGLRATKRTGAPWQCHTGERAQRHPPHNPCTGRRVPACAHRTIAERGGHGCEPAQDHCGDVRRRGPSGS